MVPVRWRHAALSRHGVRDVRNANRSRRNLLAVRIASSERRRRGAGATQHHPRAQRRGGRHVATEVVASMAFFFVRLLPKRADFPANISAEEGATMQAHAVFLREQLKLGTLVAAGPVMAASGTFGMGV